MIMKAILGAGTIVAGVLMVKEHLEVQELKAEIKAEKYAEALSSRKAILDAEKLNRNWEGYFNEEDLVVR